MFKPSACHQFSMYSFLAFSPLLVFWWLILYTLGFHVVSDLFYLIASIFLSRSLYYCLTVNVCYKPTIRLLLFTLHNTMTWEIYIYHFWCSLFLCIDLKFLSAIIFLLLKEVPLAFFNSTYLKQVNSSSFPLESLHFLMHLVINCRFTFFLSLL